MKERIWEAFVLRVNQEERVKAHERTLRYLCAYYAAFAAAAAVLSALYQTESWRVLSVVTTVLLALMTVFHAANPLGARLRLIQRDLAELERLREEAGAEDADEMNIGSRLTMITASGAGVSAQERRAYERARDRGEKWQAAWEGRPAGAKRLFGYEKFLYWFIEIAGMVFLALMLLLPAAGVALAACGLF